MRRRLDLILLAGMVLAASVPVLAAEIPIAPGAPISVLVTAEGTRKAAPAELTRDDIRVQENGKDRPVTDVRRAGGNGSQILFLIDDSAGGAFDTQISSLKKFITSLPANVEVGVGYMHNGLAQMTAAFTSDHAQAANGLRVALGSGGADVSPYDSLADAAKKWPMKVGVDQRLVIMISSGLEGLGGGLPPENPYVNAGIAAAQKAGLTVYTIYNPLFGHAGHSFWRASWGQNFLSQLADETGGELYTEGFGAAVSFDRYLGDILERLNEQYVVKFEAEAENKSGLQPIKITSTVKGTSIAAPDKAFVKASM